MARLPGRVQMVVVQMTKKSLSLSMPGSLPRSSCMGNFTYTVVQGSSWYSISASARAVSSLGHQYTGLRPL